MGTSRITLLFEEKNSSFLINPGNTAPMKYEKNIVFNHGLAWKRYLLSFSNRFRMWYNFLIPRVLKKSLFNFCSESI